ncbi:MAG TPA: thiamine diphosphokinase [Sphaerochaeta sp.]|jgi:thiamine pyrophosphokinase|nr:thiamine diphosphokinase [Sphaerochaeta sp.]HOQ93798.1 thiamine diphosphokinase [Sphaerochaeta sp.]HPK46499.1 thiamine diphosphokinase [Sphaerochaeta sp.]HPY11454.1 thiamine diphosphokinase [Sphaerochaeta sp.]HQB89924.1 thiamine diphosphokinase [Sphaerochaeta sp.]
MEGRAIIVTGGSGPDGPLAISVCSVDLVICADSGYELAEHLGLRADLWVGDFDSTRTPADAADALRIIRSPRDKDQSDTELALIEARRAGYHDWVLLGGGGHRMDHLLATYALFSHYGPPLLWQTGDETMHLVSAERTFPGGSGQQTVSFLPAQLDRETTVTCRELVWPLERMRIDCTAISLSNRSLSGTFTVQIDAGPGVFVSFPVAPIP